MTGNFTTAIEMDREHQFGGAISKDGINISVIENNKRIALQWLKYISEHKIDEICQMTAETWKMHGGPPNLAVGPAGVRELFQTIGKVKQKWKLNDIIAEGDRVVVRATNMCEQESFLGIPGKGRTQIFSAISFIRSLME